MTDKKTRRYKLCVDNINTIEDIKKVLHAMNIQIQNDNIEFDGVSEYFTTEIIPRGYIKLLEKIGWEGIAKLDYDEIVKESDRLLNESK